MSTTMKFKGGCRLRGATALGALWLLTALPWTATAVPGGFNIQARLTDSSGVNRNGAYDIRFSIYDAPTGGTMQWTRTYPGVNVRNGNFQVILADIAGQLKLADVFSEDARFLEIQVLSGPGIASPPEPPMTPRQQLVSVPYSMKSQVADTLPETARLRVSSLTVAGPFNVEGGLPPDFDSGYFQVAVNQTLRINHNLGIRPRQVIIWISENQDGSGWSTVGGPLSFHPEKVYGVSIFKSEPNTLHLKVAEAVAYVWDETGYPWYYYKETGYVRILVWK